MRALIVALVYGALASSAMAQGTLVFEAHPTSPSHFLPSYGVFVLTENVLEYDLRAPFGDDVAQIQGPGMAHQDPDAPVIFELTLVSSIPPLAPVTAGGNYYEGILNLSETQRNELLSGLWYIKSFVSFTGTSTEGQIVLIPEPDFSICIAVGALFIVAFAKARPHDSSSGPNSNALS